MPLVYRCWPVVGIFVSIILVVACEEAIVQEPACSLYTVDAGQDKTIDRRSSDGIVMYAYNLYCWCFSLFCYVNCVIVCCLQAAANEVSCPFFHQLDGLEVTISLFRSQPQNAWLKQKPCEFAYTTHQIFCIMLDNEIRNSALSTTNWLLNDIV